MQADLKKLERYVHGDWSHIFHENGPDTPVRFAFDRTENKVVAMEILKRSRWYPASTDEIADVQDSVMNANETALSAAKDWGLEESNSLPDWAVAGH